VHHIGPSWAGLLLCCCCCVVLNEPSVSGGLGSGFPGVRKGRGLMSDTPGTAGLEEWVSLSGGGGEHPSACLLSCCGVK